jgi:hypothetical protein
MMISRIAFDYQLIKPEIQISKKFCNKSHAKFCLKCLKGIEVTRRRGRRRKQLLDDLGDRRGYSHLKEEALDRINWRNRFGRGCGPVV